MRLRKKTVVVTGGTHGLGGRISEALLIEGARVVCAARSEEGMERIAEIGGRRAVYRQTDVRDEASVGALMDFAADHFGRIDVLVNNAGASIDGLLRSMSDDQWTTVLDTNLGGTFRCSRAVLPYFERQGGGGRIINVSSALSTRVASGAGAYSASKAGVDMLTRTSALEFAPLGVTVNALAPGFIDEGLGRQVRENDLVWQEYGPRLLTGRLGTGAEVGAAAVFLASDDSSYVNGHVLEVNGGLAWA